MNEGDRLGSAARIREGDGIKRPDPGRKTRVADSADATVRDGFLPVRQTDRDGSLDVSRALSERQVARDDGAK
jgi:hypothetical protein